MYKSASENVQGIQSSAFCLVVILNKPLEAYEISYQDRS
jgi:hypothetical protein